MANGKPWLQHLITIETSPAVRLWTGQGALTLNSQRYEGGGKALAIGEAETRSGEPDRRMTITLSGIPTGVRRKFLQDVGPAPVTIEWIYSRDSGKSWTKIAGLSFRGRLSTPGLSDGVFQIEIETLRGDVDRGRPLRWSHEDQQRRYPRENYTVKNKDTGRLETRQGPDLGMAYMKQLSRKGTESSWPP